MRERLIHFRGPILATLVIGFGLLSGLFGPQLFKSSQAQIQSIVPRIAASSMGAVTTFTFTIPDGKLPDWKAAWLRVYPNNELDNSDPPVLKFTDNAWLKESGVRHLKAVYRQGKRLLKEDVDKATPAVIDDDVIS